MPRYSSCFWSPDYVSGIEKLSRQLLLSLGQLHELRKFVFNYMKYFHNNGETLISLAESAYPMDSSFRTSRGPRGGRVASGTRKVSGLTPHNEPTACDMDYVFRQFVEKTRHDLWLHQKTASDIDQLVLAKITAFLKHHEPQAKVHMADLGELLDEYMLSYESAESLKQEYMTISRLGDFLIKEKEAQSPTHVHEDEEPVVSAPHEDTQSTPVENCGVSFPLAITGDYLFAESRTFFDFVAALVNAVSTTKRKIPIPGYRNDIFSSEQLCDIMRREKPRGFNPTRSNLEKLGQAMLDAKILVGTGFFAKKFSSEAMWFEWSDVAIGVSRSKVSRTLPNERDTPLLPLPKIDERWSSMTSSTSRRFNGVLKSMQNSLSKHRFSEEDLEDCEGRYNEAYSTLQKQRHLLEMKILLVSKDMELFERLKIELVYQSLTKLLQILQATNSNLAAEFTQFCTRFVADLNTTENYSLEYNKALDTFSTGIYFPSLLAPSHLSNRHVGASLLSTSFQNIKLSFNLFEDIPLQSQMRDTQLELPLSLHSVPVFLYKAIGHLDTFSRQDLRDAWMQPINYQQYWLMKDALISKLQNFRAEISAVNSAELKLMLVVTAYIEDKDVFRLVNFLKNWLLEISDSVIPSTVYDSLVANYKVIKDGDEDNTQRLADTLRILGAIPRSNLSSLVHIMEHMAKIFELDLIDERENLDTIKNAETRPNRPSLKALASNLNAFEAIAAIPFLHLIMRPSIAKNASGYHPPLEQYNMLLEDLLAVHTRRELSLTLVASEEHFIKRQEIQKQNLGIHKIQEPRERSSSVTKQPCTHTSAIDTLGIPRHEAGTNDRALLSPKVVNGETFELRPFRTRTTPRPSPSASPIAPNSKK